MSLLIGVLIASLAGSIHCAAMCGGFVCVYSGLGSRSHAPGLAAHAAYQGGRLVSYVTLGLVAGSLGAGVDSAARLANIERGATIIAGLLMVSWASARIASLLGIRVPSLPGSSAAGWIRQQFGNLLLSLHDQPAVVRAGALGLLTTLLPCGWLYTFVVTAGGTGNELGGAAVMAVFWLGTVPMLMAVGLGVQRIRRPIAQRLPVVGAALVLVLGVLSLTGKLRQLPAIGSARASSHGHMVHGAP